MSRRDWLTAAVITVVAVAVAAYLLRDDGDDPRPGPESETPSARVMSTVAADELMRRLSQRGWGCFDSLRDPLVKRCFFDDVVADGGTVAGDVAFTFADGYLARVNLYLAGERDAQLHAEIARQTARLAGDVLLDGAGDELADRVGVRQETEIAGRLVAGNRSPGSSVQVIIESASYADPEMPAPNFPAEAELVRAAEAGGLTCTEAGSSTTCGGTETPSMTITMAKASGRIGSLTISASNYAVPDDPVVVNRVVGYLFETRLGGSRASGWLRQHADSVAPVRADIGGLSLRLRGGDDHALYLSATAIAN